ncbi:MAG: hypothetical protein PHG67_09900 [Bacteroidales bacterium]|nr:hypothetical protein [Bacteroidales bacterium]
MSSIKTQISWANDQVAFYLSPVVQSHHVFDLMLQEIERADETIMSSFAITEGYVRRIIRNRIKLGFVRLFLDFTVASRNPANTNFAAVNVDELLLTTNHSKTIYMRNSQLEMLAIMSNNATNNQRFESGVIFKNHPAIRLYLDQVQIMKDAAVLWMK